VLIRIEVRRDKLSNANRASSVFRATPRRRAVPGGTAMIEISASEPLGKLEVVHTFHGPMPTGVSVSQNERIFVCFPRWDDPVLASVVELYRGTEVAFPDEAWNQFPCDDDTTVFVSVQSVVVDSADRLWALDTGRPAVPAGPGQPKLVCFDLVTRAVKHVVTFPPTVALATSYLNDVRFDLRHGDAGVAYITDSAEGGPNGIVVVDLASGASWRRLTDHPSTRAQPLEAFRPMIEGRPFLHHPKGEHPTPVRVGADGIALSADGSRLYYCPLASRNWYSVSTDALMDRRASDERVASTIIDQGDKGGGADGLETDDHGRIYLTSYEHNAVLRRLPNGRYETVVHDPRLLWPDTLSVAANRHLYITANQLHRRSHFHHGQDLRRKPYALFRTQIDAGPVRLRR
jgi:sugar lactone lactonase YvrE